MYMVELIPCPCVSKALVKTSDLKAQMLQFLSAVNKQIQFCDFLNIS